MAGNLYVLAQLRLLHEQPRFTAPFGTSMVCISVSPLARSHESPKVISRHLLIRQSRRRLTFDPYHASGATTYAAGNSPVRPLHSPCHQSVSTLSMLTIRSPSLKDNSLSSAAS